MNFKAPSFFSFDVSPFRLAGAVLVGLALSLPTALAAPIGGSVEIGEASIDSKGPMTLIEQKTDRLLVNWDSFDTAEDEGVIFNQPSASSLAVNVIHSKSPTSFQGSLSANGKIVLINENGIVFGKAAQLDVASLVATTVNIDKKSFEKDKVKFSSKGDEHPEASIENHGRISTVKGGMVALIGQTVANSGLIEARVGTVHLASGNEFVVDFVGDGLVSLALNGEMKKQLVENTGHIDASDGKIYVSVAGAERIADEVINMKGLLDAQTVEVIDGKIKINYLKDKGRKPREEVKSDRAKIEAEKEMAERELAELNMDIVEPDSKDDAEVKETVEAEAPVEDLASVEPGTEPEVEVVVAQPVAPVVEPAPEALPEPEPDIAVVEPVSPPEAHNDEPDSDAPDVAVIEPAAGAPDDLNDAIAEEPEIVVETPDEIELADVAEDDAPGMIPGLVAAPVNDEPDADMLSSHSPVFVAETLICTSPRCLPAFLRMHNKGAALPGTAVTIKARDLWKSDSL